MINCCNLTVKYGDFYALNGLHLTVEAHSTCAIIGRSGSGKTTLLHLVSGLKQADEGQVQILGQAVTSVRKDTSVVLQSDSLFPWKTVEQNLLLALREGWDNRGERVQKVLQELEVERHRHKYPNELSGGEKQRVAIARALVNEPDILVMDEPTSSLDAITKEAIQKQILELHRQHGMTLLLVTHDIEEAVFLGQKIVVLKDGNIQKEMDNPLFGSVELRKQLGFYEKCIALREVLDA